MVQWLGLGAFTVVGPGSVPGRGTKIPEATQCGQKKKKERKEKKILYKFTVRIDFLFIYQGI